MRIRNAVLTAFFLVLAGAAAVSAENGRTLVLDLKMDEGQGLAAKDSSGFNNNGAIKGAEWTQGKSGGALSFSGDQKVEVRDSLSLHLAGNLTIDFWMKGTSSGSLVGKYSPGDNQRSFLLYFRSGRLNLQINGTGLDSPYYWEQMKEPISEDVWHHIIVSVHDVKGPSKVKMLVDGVPMETFSHLGGEPFTAIHAGTAPLVIGPYSGAIDELCIYNDSPGNSGANSGRAEPKAASGK